MIKKMKLHLHRFWNLSRTSSIAIRRARLEELQNARKEEDIKCLSGFGYKIFSQSDEDGIISEIFNRIGFANKIFIEFGVGNGLENNTLALLINGWSGLWIEGSSNFCKQIEKGLDKYIDKKQLIVRNAFITVNNIDLIISESISEKEIDLLSIDIDSNDAHILEAIKVVHPRVIVMEYNAKFGPSINYRMPYNEEYIWQKTDQFGSSLKNLEITLSSLGYSCVGCNVVGTNAFFVRNDLVDNKFIEPYTSEMHFEPGRYELVGLPSGHPASYETINNMDHK